MSTLTDQQATGTGFKTRQLTICNKYFPRAKGFNRAGHVVFPIISLSGKWLQDCGFAAGQLINIACHERQLIITVAKECKFDDDDEQ